MAILDIIKKGTTDYSATIRIVDSADGTPETGVVAATAGLSFSYWRGAADGGTMGSVVEIGSGTYSNLATAATAHTAAGIIHLGNGYYRLDLPDAAIAAGAQWVDIFGTATDMIVMGGRIELTAISFQTLVNMGMTALPAFAADAAGGLVVSDTGGLDADAMAASVAAIETDTSSAGVIVATNNDKTGYALSAAGVDAIWDENLSGHVAANSAGASLYVIRSNTAQAGTTTSITLDASASASNDFYNNQRVYVVSGTGANQGSYITDYDGTTKVADIQDTWITAPSTDSVFVIVPAGGIPGASAPSAATVADAVWDEVASGHASEGTFGSLFQPAQVGTAQAGAASSITLDATGASATTDYYKYGFVKIIGGTGAGQPARQVSAYNGTTKVATVSLPWTVNPDNTSEYILTADFGIDAATVDALADAVWDEARSEHVQAGSFGERVNANATQLSGSSAAADALEAATTGATPLPSNTTQWLGTAAATPTTAGVPEVDVTFVGGVAEDIATATALSTMQGNVTDILTDTGTTIPGLLGTPVADLATDIAGVKAVADAIEVDTQNIQGRIPAALNNGVMPADTQRINDVEIVGDGSGTPFNV